MLGVIVAKAHAYVMDSRDIGRHADDITVLTEIALIDPGTTLRQVKGADRRAVRRFLRDKSPDFFRGADEPKTIWAFLTRLADGD